MYSYSLLFIYLRYKYNEFFIFMFLSFIFTFVLIKYTPKDRKKNIIKLGGTEWVYIINNKKVISVFLSNKNINYKNRYIHSLNNINAFFYIWIYLIKGKKPTEKLETNDKGWIFTCFIMTTFMIIPLAWKRRKHFKPLCEKINEHHDLN